MGGNVWLYALLGILLIVLVNVALVAMLRREGTHHQINIVRQVFKDIRSPYRKEDEMLSELSKRVAGLKQVKESSEQEDSGR
jgi:hypothetical protein